MSSQCVLSGELPQHASSVAPERRGPCVCSPAGWWCWRAGRRRTRPPTATSTSWLDTRTVTKPPSPRARSRADSPPQDQRSVRKLGTGGTGTWRFSSRLLGGVGLGWKSIHFHSWEQLVLSLATVWLVISSLLNKSSGINKPFTR